MSFNPAEIEVIDRLSGEAVEEMVEGLKQRGWDMPLNTKSMEQVEVLVAGMAKMCMKMINEEVPRIQRDIDSRNKEQS